MQFVSGSFIEANLPYLTLVAAVAGCLVLCLGVSLQMQRLFQVLTAHRQRVEALESQIQGGTRGAAGRTDGVAAASIREEVLRLHRLGRSPEEIVRDTGLRGAEVDFVLKVNEHLQLPSSTMALRKIS
jgi:hypothetical protein